MTTNSEAKDTNALDCAKHFKGVMKLTDKVEGRSREWTKLCRSLLDDNGLTPAELKTFMTWAAQENTHDTPQFSSVDYLAKANDPLVSLVKNSTGLIKVWRVQQNRKKYTKVAAPNPTSKRWCNTRVDRYMAGSADYKACQAQVTSLFEKGGCKYPDFGAYFASAKEDTVWDCEFFLFASDEEALAQLKQVED